MKFGRVVLVMEGLRSLLHYVHNNYLRICDFISHMNMTYPTETLF